jgi:hypothetical protein
MLFLQQTACGWFLFTGEVMPLMSETSVGWIRQVPFPGKPYSLATLLLIRLFRSYVTLHANVRVCSACVLQALQSCSDRSCAPGSLQQQRTMAVLSATQGPVWSRQQAQGREGSVCRHLEQVSDMRSFL